MSFCSRCGEQVGTDALFCPNCGARLTLPPIRHASPSSKLTSRFDRYFSKSFLYWIILSAILIFSILIVGGHQGEQVTVEQAQQVLMEIEKEIGYLTAFTIFSNNVKIALISFIPIIGSTWMLFVQYNTGFIFGNIAKAYGVHVLSSILLTLGNPIGLFEYTAYILTLSESFMIVHATVKKQVRTRLLKQTWKTLFVVIGLLVIGGIVEALVLGIPII